jgi:molybdopterin/thiamine biosynthesis adenylyltransferase
LARVAASVGLGVQVVAVHVTTDNVGHLVREGDIVLLAVDNHAARALLDRHVATLRDATLISGGNDETDGNVQVVRRRNGWSVDGHLVEIHPEIGEAADREALLEPGCQVLAVERPQLLVANLMVASAMLNALWQVVEHGSVPYSEVYLDVTQCAARPRRWFRLRPGEQ